MSKWIKKKVETHPPLPPPPPPPPPPLSDKTFTLPRLYNFRFHFGRPRRVQQVQHLQVKTWTGNNIPLQQQQQQQQQQQEEEGRKPSTNAKATARPGLPFPPFYQLNGWAVLNRQNTPPHTSHWVNTFHQLHSIALKLLLNCSETVLKLVKNCSETALKLLCNCSEIALKLFQNCTETALKLLRNCPETVLKLL